MCSPNGRLGRFTGLNLVYLSRLYVQVCLFCYDRVKNECKNECPKCRQEYGDPVDPAEIRAKVKPGGDALKKKKMKAKVKERVAPIAVVPLRTGPSRSSAGVDRGVAIVSGSGWSGGQRGSMDRRGSTEDTTRTGRNYGTIHTATVTTIATTTTHANQPLSHSASVPPTSAQASGATSGAPPAWTIPSGWARPSSIAQGAATSPSPLNHQGQAVGNSVDNTGANTSAPISADNAGWLTIGSGGQTNHLTGSSMTSLGMTPNYGATGGLTSLGNVAGQGGSSSSSSGDPSAWPSLGEGPHRDRDRQGSTETVERGGAVSASTTTTAAAAASVSASAWLKGGKKERDEREERKAFQSLGSIRSTSNTPQPGSSTIGVVSVGVVPSHIGHSTVPKLSAMGTASAAKMNPFGGKQNQPSSSLGLGSGSGGGHHGTSTNTSTASTGGGTNRIEMDGQTVTGRASTVTSLAPSSSQALGLDHRQYATPVAMTSTENHSNKRYLTMDTSLVTEATGNSVPHQHEHAVSMSDSGAQAESSGPAPIPAALNKLVGEGVQATSLLERLRLAAANSRRQSEGLKRFTEYNGATAAAGSDQPRMDQGGVITSAITVEGQQNLLTAVQAGQLNASEGAKELLARLRAWQRTVGPLSPHISKAFSPEATGKTTMTMMESQAMNMTGIMGPSWWQGDPAIARAVGGGGGGGGGAPASNGGNMNNSSSYQPNLMTTPSQGGGVGGGGLPVTSSASDATMSATNALLNALNVNLNGSSVDVHNTARRQVRGAPPGFEAGSGPMSSSMAMAMSMGMPMTSSSSSSSSSPMVGHEMSRPGLHGGVAVPHDSISAGMSSVMGGMTAMMGGAGGSHQGAGGTGLSSGMMMMMSAGGRDYGSLVGHRHPPGMNCGGGSVGAVGEAAAGFFSSGGGGGGGGGGPHWHQQPHMLQASPGSGGPGTTHSAGGGQSGGLSGFSLLSGGNSGGGGSSGGSQTWDLASALPKHTINSVPLYARANAGNASSTDVTK